MIVSVGIVALNEEKTLPKLFEKLNEQDYDHSKIELILIDSMSTDGTKRVMQEYKQNADFFDVKIIDNPDVILAFGCNKLVKNSIGEVIIRIDAHAEIPSDFITKNIELIKSGEKVCGGRRPNILAEYSEFGEMLLVAESTAFGSSIAKYRNGNKKQYVDSLFHAAVKREVYEDIGLFNTNLHRTEDNEIFYRMKKAGYKICMDPDIISYQHVRSSLKKMLKQKYSNGYWCGLTFGVCPKCLKIYHFVPAVFAASLGIAFFIKKLWSLPYRLILGSYMAVNLLMSIRIIVKEKIKNKFRWTLPFLFFGIHISYGIGTLVGFFKLKKWKKTYDKNGENIKLTK